jgi:spore germination cell wall hydrolase CwlJ-like protein
MGWTPKASAQIAEPAPAPVVSPLQPPSPQVAPGAQALAEAKPARSPRYSSSDMSCLASAMYHEARSEPVEGQIAIAEVVIARSKDQRWKGSLCRTIAMRRQFSFVRNGHTPKIPDPNAAAQMQRLAKDVVDGRVRSRAKGSLFFHATYADPAWRHHLTRRVRIQRHIFYVDATS